jgi:hypothetical protein
MRLRSLHTLPLLWVLLSGCGRGDALGIPGVELSVALAPTPAVVGPNRVVLTLTDSLGAPVDGARIELEGTMTHAGMVPVFRGAQAEGGGRYRVDDMTFTMAGEWVLRAHTVLADGREGILEGRTRVVGPR